MTSWVLPYKDKISSWTDGATCSQKSFSAWALENRAIVGSLLLAEIGPSLDRLHLLLAPWGHDGIGRRHTRYI